MGGKDVDTKRTIELADQTTITPGRALRDRARGCDRMRDRTPPKKQRRYYSGKKKKHTLKIQLVADASTLDVLCIFVGKGSQHDFSPKFPGTLH